MKEMNAKNVYPLKPVVKVNLKKESVFWSVGMMQLLQNIEQFSSLRKACDEMGLSYSKGHRILREAEKSLGFHLVKSQTGGSSGGMTELTAEGRNFLKCYISYNEKVKEYADGIFSLYFSEYD